MSLRDAWPLAVILFVAAWGGLSAQWMFHHGVAGFTTDAARRVSAVTPGSAAAEAGIRPGDVLLGIHEPVPDDRVRSNGVPAGEVRRVDLLREGEAISLAVTFAPPAGQARLRRVAALALGALFLLIPSAGLRLRPARLTRILFLAGAGTGLAFMGEPSFAGDPLRAAVMALRNALILAGVAAAVQFAFEYSRPGRMATWVYAPAAAYWLVLDWRLLAPQAAGLAPVAGLAGGILLTAALACILVVLLRAWIRGWRTGEPPLITPVFTATLFGLLMVAMAVALEHSLQTHLPGQSLWFLALLVIPLAWTAAAVSAAGRVGDSPA